MSRKIDRLIAQHIMSNEILWGDTIPHYSTDIAKAWEVVEEMNPEYNFFIRMLHRPAVRVIRKEYMGHENTSTIFDESAPMAICLAALKAKGVEVDD